MKLVRLREWRTRRGFSQQELSGRSEVARDAISKLENGRREASPLTARRLAEALGVTPEQLVYSPRMERPPWGAATGAVLDAAREAGEEEELLTRFAEEAGDGPARAMYDAYLREAGFSRAVRERKVSELPGRSGALLLAYAQIVGSFLERGVAVPRGLARGVAEVLAREGEDEKDGRPE